MKNVTSKIIDGVILSIPLLVMVLLAAVTWWLVLLAPEGPTGGKVKSLRAGPDLILENFMVERFDHSGALRSNLLAIKAERFPSNNEIVAYQLDLMTTESAQSGDGAQPLLSATNTSLFRITAVADKGVLHDKQSMIELIGQAYVTRQPYRLEGDAEKIEFVGDELKILLDEGKMYSDLPVDISQDGTRFTANSMVYDYATNTIQLKGRVVGNAQPVSR